MEHYSAVKKKNCWDRHNNMHELIDMKLSGKKNQHKRVHTCKTYRTSPAILGEVKTGEEHVQTYYTAKNAPYLVLSRNYIGLYVYDNALLYIKICVLYSMLLNIINNNNPTHQN